MHTPITFPKPRNGKRCLQSKGSHWQISLHKLWMAYVMITTTTFLRKCWKISWQNQGCLKTDLTAKTEHTKLQYSSFCQGPQIWRTSLSRNCTRIFQGNLQQNNWYHYQFDWGQVWATWIQSVLSGWAVILKVRKQRRSVRWNHDRQINLLWGLQSWFINHQATITPCHFWWLRTSQLWRYCQRYLVVVPWEVQADQKCCFDSETGFS